MTPSGIEPATFRFVAQYLNRWATAVPIVTLYLFTVILITVFWVKTFVHSDSYVEMCKKKQLTVTSGKEGGLQ